MNKIIILCLLSFSFSVHAKVKNVILLIGDGMGPAQVSLLYAYKRYAKKYTGDRVSNIAKMANSGTVGSSNVEPYGALVVDSAGSATQLATGSYSRNGMIGLDYNGHPVPTILERAKLKGMAVGLVSDTRITHATPASFAAHVANRGQEQQIAEQLLANKVDVLLSGGTQFFIPQSRKVDPSVAKLMYKKLLKKSKRKDDKDLLKQAQDDGYQLAFDRAQLAKADGEKLLGLFMNSALPNGIEMSAINKLTNRKIPNLMELTLKALDTLSKNKNGFFLMVEGGQIDWAAHGNDVGSMLHNMLHFDEAIGAVLEWQKKNPDTLVVLTADHETGGFGFSYSGHDLPSPEKLRGNLFKELPYNPGYNFVKQGLLDRYLEQTIDFDDLFRKFDDRPKKEQTALNLQSFINDHVPFPISLGEAKMIMEEEENPLYNPQHKHLSAEKTPKVAYAHGAFAPYGKRIRKNILAKIISKQQGVVWSTATHTSAPVLVMAVGPKSELKNYDGFYHHTELGKKLQRSLGVEVVRKTLTKN